MDRALSELLNFGISIEKLYSCQRHICSKEIRLPQARLVMRKMQLKEKYEVCACMLYSI